jgi:MoaA/NifB/PqqE/SkfB family radical SAM enzyme
MDSISPEDRRDFHDLLRVWKPGSRPDAIILRWRVTEWCNYACRYCSQEHGRFAGRGDGFTSHAFDNFPVEQWQAAFARHFGPYRLSIAISGGEPFLDRKSMIPMLNFLTAMPGTECIRIDTNAAWKPEAYRELDRSKILLNCSFHSSEVEESAFVASLRRILDHGFRVGMVNYVMAAEQFDGFAERRRVFAGLGVPLNPNPDFERACDYSPAQRELLEAHLPEIDYRFKVLRESPLGRKCLYPALTYELDFRGLLKVACVGAETASLFGETLPPLPPGPVACPQGRCECLDMYSFLKGSTRNTTTNPLRDYCEQLKTLAPADFAAAPQP